MNKYLFLLVVSLLVLKIETENAVQDLCPKNSKFHDKNGKIFSQNVVLDEFVSLNGEGFKSVSKSIKNEDGFYPNIISQQRIKREDEHPHSKDLLYNPFLQSENNKPFLPLNSITNHNRGGINLSSNPFLATETKPLANYTPIYTTETLNPHVNQEDLFRYNPFFNGAIAISSFNGNLEKYEGVPSNSNPVTTSRPTTKIQATTSHINNIKLPQTQSSILPSYPFENNPTKFTTTTLQPAASYINNIKLPQAQSSISPSYPFENYPTKFTATTSQPSEFHVNMKLPQAQSSTSSISPSHPFENYPNGDICGRPSMIQLIVKGRKVETGAYPWIAALYHIYDESHFTYQCGATLVSQKHIITAAHCVIEKLHTPSEIFFKLGKVTIDDASLVLDSKHGVYTASEIYINPEYNKERHSAHGDIAVVVLSENVTFNQYVRPVCLWIFDPDLSIIVDSVGTVVGWGRDETGMISTSAKSAVLPIVSQEECLRSSSEYFILTSNTTFCAGNRDATGPCSGDSGSGLVQSRGGRYILRGVVSTALVDGTTRHKCDLSKYLIFADCGKYQNWLLSFIK